VHVFTRDGQNWLADAKLEIAGVAPNAELGPKVALFANTAILSASEDNPAGLSTAGRIHVFQRNPGWTQVATLIANDAAVGDRFGVSSAVWGETILVGAFHDDTLAGGDAGSAYLFTRSETGWEQAAHLSAGDGSAYEYFGASVALEGDTALIGATDDDTATVINSGSAYLFVRQNNIWMFRQKLQASDPAAFGSFGASVALTTDIAAVGAQSKNAVYLFRRAEANWLEQTKIAGADTKAGHRFGFSMALDGDTLLVGAPDADFPTGGGFSVPGSAYVFVRSGNAWTQQAQFRAEDGAERDNFGHAVALDQDIAVIGAPMDDVGIQADAGSVCVFVREGATWTQTAKLTAAISAAGDAFGSAVAISGSTFVIGAPGDDTAAGVDTGSSTVFIAGPSGWERQTTLTVKGAAAGDRLGFAVALSGNKAVLGASAADAGAIVNAGSAYLFVREQTSWSEHAKWIAPDGTAHDAFGGAVALSGDTALIGARFHDSFHPDSGDLRTDHGSVYVFRIHPPDFPRMTVQRMASAVLISWPSDQGTDFVLQESKDLRSPDNWINSPEIPVADGSQKTVTVPATGIRFYRLRKD
jgi:hypothetical protein